HLQSRERAGGERTSGQSSALIAAAKGGGKMSESFDLPQVDRLTADAVGPPGQRVFYLQARRGAELVSLKLEKQQVAALAGYLTAMLADLPVVAGTGADDPGGNMGLEEPVEEAWIVGSIGVAYDEP